MGEQVWKGLSVALAVAVLVLLAAGGAGYWYMDRENTKLTKENSSLTLAKGSLETQVLTLTTTLEKQNKSIRDLAKASEDASKAAQAAIIKQRQEAAKWKAAYNNILTAPKPVADDCEALNIKLNQYLDMRESEAQQ